MPGANLRKFAAKLAGFGAQLNIAFAAGAAADTNITITGIKPGDEVVGAFEIQPPTAASGNAIKTNLTAEIKITANDTIQCDTTATTGNQVLIFWVSNPRKKKL